VLASDSGHSIAKLASPAPEPGRLSAVLNQLSAQLPVERRMLKAGQFVYRAGQPFGCLFVINAGYVKVVNNSPDGRGKVVGLHFRGGWLGFDGIAPRHYGSDAVALDTGELWSLRYDSLLQASVRCPALLELLHAEMSRAISRGREQMLSLCTLPAAERVAGFLRDWGESMAEGGRSADQFTLRMTRADIGDYLGMTLESVSRALSGLARQRLIQFAEQGRRDIRIPDLRALRAFAQGPAAQTRSMISAMPCPTPMHMVHSA
jgi:CRP/FNR family transcriptional regulator